MKIGIPSRILVLLVICPLLLMPSCAVNPVTGKKDLMLMSEQQEIALGQQSDPGIIASYGLYPDEELQAFINEKGKEMAAISHRPYLDYQFRILDSPVVNAFAVPGGFVYFTRGIMAHFNNEAEFAGVLGHEIGHITARHSAKQYSKQMLAQVGLIAGMVASPEFAKFADVAQQGVGLLLLKYGRDDESQSDELGVEYSTRVGYDAHYMANFFETLDRINTYEGRESLPEFLSTHPNPINRSGKVRRHAEDWQRKLNYPQLQENRDTYLRIIDGIVYGDDPRQGYVERNVFYHPELRFQYPVPQNWITVNTPSQVQHGTEDGKAAIMLSLAGEKTLQAAAEAFANLQNMQVVESYRDQVNGQSAIVIRSDFQNPQNPSSVISILAYFIEYGSNIYEFLGLAGAKDFYAYQGVFRNTFTRFRRLTDPSKINRQPERIRIVTVRSSGTLEDVLRTERIPSNRMEEMAIINSMELNTPLERGMLIKVVR